MIYLIMNSSADLRSFLFPSFPSFFNYLINVVRCLLLLFFSFQVLDFFAVFWDWSNSEVQCDSFERVNI